MNILYADGCRIETTPYGFNIHFKQGNRVISRVAISKKHAESLVDIMSKHFKLKILNKGNI